MYTVEHVRLAADRLFTATTGLGSLGETGLESQARDLFNQAKAMYERFTGKSVVWGVPDTDAATLTGNQTVGYRKSVNDNLRLAAETLREAGEAECVELAESVESVRHAAAEAG